MNWILDYYYIFCIIHTYITDLQPLIDRLSELEDKIGTLEAKNENQTLKINQLETETENQTLEINQLKAVNENQTLTIKQLHQMLQDRNDSYGNFYFLLSLFTQG